MVTVRFLLAMAAFVASPIPTRAQWNIENHFGNPKVTATGADGLIHVALRCQEDSVFLTLTLLI